MAPTLAAGSAYASIVNVAAAECSTTSYIVPGNAAQSYLIAKVTAGGAVGTCAGGTMSSYLPAGDLTTLTTWVNQGANNN
jgi:hypothetical protein